MDSEAITYLSGSNRYGNYCVPASSKHRVAAAAILAGRVYEPRTIGFMLAHCGAGDIVHAGTYFGDFLAALGQGVQAQALIWAFEPNRENFYCATKTIELNGLQNVRLMNAALGAESGTMLLQVGGPGGSGFGGGSRLVRSQSPGAVCEEAKIVAVDETVPSDRQVSILQLDVEGSEQHAIAGALATIRRCMPIVVLEKLPRDEAWFQQNFLAFGYELRGRVHSNSVFAPHGIEVTLRRKRNRQQHAVLHSGDQGG
ncbi:MAG TPA: FkbM family methyltransferase [Rhizomicrobium sp.]|jgi:FkbM family methyltransferase|nr:FkbM family methyltransferase [Rhizomicrobium sp.]